MTVSFSDIIPSRSDPNAFGATDDYPVLGARVWPMLVRSAVSSEATRPRTTIAISPGVTRGAGHTGGDLSSYHAAHEVPAIQQQRSWPPLLPLAL